jgi:hypothetical protein
MASPAPTSITTPTLSAITSQSLKFLFDTVIYKPGPKSL